MASGIRKSRRVLYFLKPRCLGRFLLMAISKYAAYFVSEFLCTGMLVGCTTLSCSALNNALIPMSIAYGFINLLVTNCFSQLSGGYANPSIVLALWWRGCMPITKFIVYVAAEISGAAGGHYAINRLLGKPPTESICTVTPSTNLPDNNLMAAEFLLTFLLVMTWCVLWDYEGELPMEWYIAGANALVYFLGVYLTGASTNPARTIIPMFFKGKAKSIQICIAGQLLAGLAAPFLWGLLKFWTKT